MRGACLSPKDSPRPDFGPTQEIIPFDSSLLLAEADHRIANHLALLTGYVRLKTADFDRQCTSPSRQAVHALLDGVGAQIDAVARLHRTLCSDAGGPANLGEHLREVCAPFENGLGGATRIVEDLSAGCIVGAQQVLPLSQIAAEVLTNALKHAEHRAEPTVVLVRCRKDRSGAVRLEIIDSGGGFPAGFDPQTDGGLGFRLVRALGKKLGARISFESTAAGVHFSLTLPPPTAAQP